MANAPSLDVSIELGQGLSKSGIFPCEQFTKFLNFPQSGCNTPLSHHHHFRMDPLCDKWYEGRRTLLQQLWCFVGDMEKKRTYGGSSDVFQWAE